MRTWSHSDCGGRTGRLSVGARQLRNETRQLGKAGSGRGGDPLGVDVADEGPQGFDDRPEGQALVTEGHRPALEDEPAAIAQRARSLGDQPALADSRLAADQDERGLAGHDGVGRGEERLELVRAADEDGAGEPPDHDPNDRAGCRPSFPREGRHPRGVMRRTGLSAARSRWDRRSGG